MSSRRRPSSPASNRSPEACPDVIQCRSPSKRVLAQQRAVYSKVKESAIVLSANAVLATFAIVGLSKLIPYYQDQASKLQALQAEVKAAQARVQKLQESYERDRNPQSFNRVAREDGNLIPKNQQPVILVQPSPLLPSPVAPVALPKP